MYQSGFPVTTEYSGFSNTHTTINLGNCDKYNDYNKRSHNNLNNAHYSGSNPPGNHLRGH